MSAAMFSRWVCRSLLPSMRPSLCCTSSARRSFAVSAKRNSQLTPMQKRILVWTKKYPSLDKVPDTVSPAVMSKAIDKFRWRIAVVGMILTILGSAAMVASGKRAAGRGESITKRSLAWHEELRPGSTSRE